MALNFSNPTIRRRMVARSWFPPWAPRPGAAGRDKVPPPIGIVAREPLASLVPVHALAALVALLRLDRQGGDGAGLQPPERDRLAGLLAEAVGAVVDALQRGVDL